MIPNVGDGDGILDGFLMAVDVDNNEDDCYDVVVVVDISVMFIVDENEGFEDI
jgi:hypothetical protein